MDPGEHPDDEGLRQALRAADPARSSPPLDPHWTRRTVENVMSTTQQTPANLTPRGRTRRRRVVGLVAACGVAAAVVVTGAVALFPRSADVTHLTVAPVDVSAMCAVITPEALAQHESAFEATVVGISAGEVTLEVTRRFAGDVGDRVVVAQQDDTMPGELSIAPFEDGGDYLVSTDGGRVAACGHSGPVGPELLALYEQAYGG